MSSAIRARVVIELASAGYPVDTVSQDAPYVVTYMQGTPQANIDAGNAFLAGLDLSQAAQDVWERDRLRVLAIQAIANKNLLGDVIRAIVVLVIDQLNLLRGQFIGGAVSVWNPASMANGTGVTSPNITVTGAAFGDVVDVAAPYSLSGIVATAYVSASNTVNIRLHNSTGGAVDLANGNWSVGVRRPTVLAQLSYDQGKTALINAIQSGNSD